ncbi:hypothetical protein BGZ46_006777 [Entomortierella lignicola]|nr:hypothetical protein BGZ46_006777 [Entomortierella lignicola]
MEIFALPEICERISLSIDKKTITSCLRVNRAWNSSWLPILWHTIDAGHQWRHAAFQNALGKHGDLIRILKCSRYDNINLLFKTEHAICRNLIKLVLPKSTLANQQDHVRLLRQNPHLRDVSLGLQDDTPSQYTELFNAVGGLRYLTRLALDENKIVDANTLETILSKCNDSLRELSFKGTSFIRHPFRSGEEFASGLLAFSDVKPQPGVEVLTSDMEIETKDSFGIMSLCLEHVTCTEDQILNLVSRFPLLSHLSLKESTEVYFSMDFAERLAKRCPKLKNIDISTTEDTDDDKIASLIKSFPKLQIFKASQTRFGNSSLSTLVECCSDHITILEINSTCSVYGQVVQQLLEKCWALRRFEAWEVSANVPNMMMEAYGTGKQVGASNAKRLVTADGTIISTDISFNAIRGQWSCRGIESLVICFDYDSEELSENDQQLFSVSKARRFIYEQLSQLTKLKYLAIGGTLLSAVDSRSEYEENNEAEENCTHPDKALQRIATGQTHCEDPVVIADQLLFDDSSTLWIDFSLRSGLFMLSPLKDLRTLCLSAMDHTIRVPEIIWISRNWPNLQSIEGLYEDDDEDVVDWLRKNCPHIKIDDEDEEY